MDVVERMFGDLESNNSVRVEESKKRLSENFSQTKESWLINGMMDYFSQTNSSRIVDILVKVQPPHDKFIFDRLAEWLSVPSHRNQSITLFGHIVKKHPSWLHKVAGHVLFRDILKLLRTETNVITIMNALFCLIILLPIIPTSMPQYLADLFEIFLYLATWNCDNQPRITDDQMVHLHIGLSTFFQRLYGMYPCNFISYLRDHVITDHATVFAHTIRPLLETVKMHPMLLTSNRELEKHSTRWKEMEPHDVVVECSKFALDYPNATTSSTSAADPIGLIAECPYYKLISRQSATATPVSQQLLKSLKSTPVLSTNLSSPFYSPFNDLPRLREPQRIDNMWSPLMSVMATPPPIGVAAPATPTAALTSFAIQTIPSSIGTAANNAAAQQHHQHQLLCISGSSPPEAAVEATPETTPMKDSAMPSVVRAFPVNSTAVRAIWGSSQPSSPLKREQPGPSFRFSSDLSNAEVPALSSPKIMSFVNERSMYAHQIHDALLQASMTVGGEHDDDAAVESAEAACSSGLALVPSGSDSAQEDAEVTQINRSAFSRFKAKSTNSGHSSRSDHDADDGDDTTTAEEEEHNSKPNATQALEPKSKLLRSKRSNFANKLDRKTVGTQTLDQLPQTYQQIFVDLLDISESNKVESSHAAPPAHALCPNSPVPLVDSVLASISSHARSTPLSPNSILDQCIETTVKKRESEPANHRVDMFRDQIQLLNLQLQFERYRREVHAERNRRLLGKSRVNAALIMDNDRLLDQKKQLAADAEGLTLLLNKARVARIQQDQDYERECQRYQREIQGVHDEKKALKETIEAMHRTLGNEQRAKRELTSELEAVRAEMFDMRNELLQTQERAEVGLHCKNELFRLQSEVVLMGEIQMKCKDKLSELDGLKARDEEAENVRAAYTEEVKEMRSTLETKSSQLDSAKTRMHELELQLSRRDTMFIDQKRLLKTVKEEYQDRFRSLEEKYKAQKAVILRFEEELLEMFHKTQTAAGTNTNSSSSDVDKPNDQMTGSLDHTSPLSISLASSEGLSMSLRSTTTEIRNLHQLVSAAEVEASEPNANAAGPSSSASRQPVSEDIPVPSSAHHHHHQKHNHL